MRHGRFTYLLLVVALLMLWTSSTSGKEVIRFANWSPDSSIQRFIDEFNASQNEIVVEWESISLNSYFEKITVAVAGGVGPDVMQVHPERGPVTDWREKGILLDLTPYLQRDAAELQFPSDWFQPALADGRTSDGKYYGLPIGWAVFGILDYNIDLFEVNGIGRPNLAWTWNDLVKTAERLTTDTNGDGKLERFGISKYLWDAWRQVSSFVRATGASVYSSGDTTLTLNTAGATRALRFLEDEIIKKGLLGGNFIKETVGIQTGEGIMHVLGSDSQAVAPFRRGMAVMPKDPVTGGRSFTGLAAPMIGISKTTAHPEAAWKFVKYLTEAWFAGYWKEKGYSAQLPTRRSVAQRYFMKPEAGKIDPNMDLSVALDLINYSYFDTASTNPWANLNKSQIEAALTTEWRKVLSGTVPYSAMITNAETRVNALLQGK